MYSPMLLPVATLLEFLLLLYQYVERAKLSTWHPINRSSVTCSYFSAMTFYYILNHLFAKLPSNLCFALAYAVQIPEHNLRCKGTLTTTCQSQTHSVPRRAGLARAISAKYLRLSANGGFRSLEVWFLVKSGLTSLTDLGEIM